MNTQLATLITLAILLGALSGCANGPEPAPETEAVTEASDEVWSTATVAGETANDASAWTIPVRYNPARCPCPDFEVWAYGSWQRVWMEGPVEALEELRTLRMEPPGTTREVTGLLTTVTRPSDRQVRYPIFELE